MIWWGWVINQLNFSRSDIFRGDQRVTIIHKYRPGASALRYWWHAFIRVTCHSVSYFFSVSLSYFFFLFYSPSASLHFLKNINSVDDDFFSMTDSFIHWGNRKNHDGSTPAETPKIVNEPTHFNYFYRSLDSISNFNSNLNQLIIKVNKFNHQFKSMKWNSFKYLEWIRLNRFISFRDCVNNFPPLSHYDRYQNYNLRSSFIYLVFFFFE